MNRLWLALLVLGGGCWAHYRLEVSSDDVELREGDQIAYRTVGGQGWGSAGTQGLFDCDRGVCTTAGWNGTDEVHEPVDLWVWLDLDGDDVEVWMESPSNEIDALEPDPEDPRGTAPMLGKFAETIRVVLELP